MEAARAPTVPAPRRILVALARDDRAGPVLVRARELAQRSGADLWVLHAIPPTLSLGRDDLSVRLKEAETWLACLGVGGGRSSGQPLIVAGSLDSELPLAARMLDADTVVVDGSTTPPGWLVSDVHPWRLVRVDP